MPTDKENEEKILNQARRDSVWREQHSFGGYSSQSFERSRFYGRDSGTQDRSQYTLPPKKEQFLLRPIPTPGVEFSKQELALRLLREANAQLVEGAKYYFHGDRINIFDLGFSAEPPILAGQVCTVTRTGYVTRGLERVNLVQVDRAQGVWIDNAYFGEELPVLFRPA